MMSIHPKIRFLLVCTLILGAMALQPSVQARSEPLPIAGTATYKGDAVSDIAVSVTNERTGDVQHTTTDADGAFVVTFGNLTGDTYLWEVGDTMTARLEGTGQYACLEGSTSFTIAEEDLQNLPIWTSITATLSFTIDFTVSPQQPVAGENVSFTSTSTGRITQYAWQFGDGNASTGENPMHIYAEAGTYTVTLTAYCHSFTKSTSSIIEVAPADNTSSDDNTGDNATDNTTDGTGNDTPGFLAPSLIGVVAFLAILKRRTTINN